MNCSKILIAVSFIAFAVPAFAQKPNVDDGKAVYTKRCASCHAASGEGNEAIAKTLKIEMPKLSSKEAQGLSDTELRKILREGKGKMKGIKELTDQDVVNVVAYLRTLAKK